MKSYEIETGFEPPAGSVTKYNFDKMKAGQSILYANEDGEVQGSKCNAANSARMFVKRNRPGWGVRTMRVNEGTRVWLVNNETSDDD